VCHTHMTLLSFSLHQAHKVHISLPGKKKKKKKEVEEAKKQVKKTSAASQSEKNLANLTK